MEGMMMGIRKELNEKEQETYTEEEGIIMGGVRVGGERWKIIGVYVKENIERHLRKMEEWIEEGNRENIDRRGF